MARLALLSALPSGLTADDATAVLYNTAEQVTESLPSSRALYILRRCSRVRSLRLRGVQGSNAARQDGQRRRVLCGQGTTAGLTARFILAAATEGSFKNRLLEARPRSLGGSGCKSQDRAAPDTEDNRLFAAPRAG